MNHRLRRRHRYLVAAVAAAVLLASLLAARRPLPDPRLDHIPPALTAPASEARPGQPGQLALPAPPR